MLEELKYYRYCADTYSLASSSSCCRNFICSSKRRLVRTPCRIFVLRSFRSVVLAVFGRIRTRFLAWRSASLLWPLLVLLLEDVEDDDDELVVGATDVAAATVVVAPNIGTSNEMCGGIHAVIGATIVAAGFVVLLLLLLLAAPLVDFDCVAADLLTGRTRSALMAAIVRALI